MGWSWKKRDERNSRKEKQQNLSIDLENKIEEERGWERKILRGIGIYTYRVYTKKGWRRRTNKELEELYGEATISSSIKGQRMRWLGSLSIIYAFTPQILSRSSISTLTNPKAMKIKGINAAEGVEFLYKVKLESPSKGVVIKPALRIEPSACRAGSRHEPAFGDSFVLYNNHHESLTPKRADVFALNFIYQKRLKWSENVKNHRYSKKTFNLSSQNPDNSFTKVNKSKMYIN